MLQPSRASKHRVGGQLLVRLRPQRHPRSLGIRAAALVLPGQPAARERAERLVGDAVLAAERKHLGLVAAGEERVRVLDGGRLPRGEHLPELGAVDIRDAPGADRPGGHQLLERAGRLGDRRVRIRLGVR
jgi:hypothetical protein